MGFCIPCNSITSTHINFDFITFFRAAIFPYDPPCICMLPMVHLRCEGFLVLLSRERTSIMFDHTLQILTNRIFLLLTKNKLLAYSLAILFALGFGIAIPMSPALAYTCYGAYGDCFAMNAWGGRTGGGFTHVTVVQLSAPGNQSQPQFDYVREELYVGDSTSSGCTYHSPVILK